YVILRYNTDGSPDNTWGTNGTKYTGINLTGDIARLAMQSDGKVLIAGNTGASGNVIVARFTNTGAADLTFDGDGKITFAALGGYNLTNTRGVGVTSGGQIIVTCTAAFNFTNEIGLIRLNSNGSIDNSYG
ncbi:hypothetical protein WB334_26635, partial [Escherichia coli]|uniref:hypothetical protein n=1 Tax=Escherichia coli TaxID=562 RepID=UPI0021577844